MLRTIFSNWNIANDIIDCQLGILIVTLFRIDNNVLINFDNCRYIFSYFSMIELFLWNVQVLLNYMMRLLLFP